MSLIILAHNEEDNVPAVLGEIIAWLRDNEPTAEIVFVDDGSSDGTAAAAEAALAAHDAKILRHAHRRGIGAAIRTGTVAAAGPWVTFLPADGQVPPDGIGTLRATVARDRSVLALSVYEGRDDGAARKLLSWGVRLLIRLIHGISLRCEGPYLFRREHFDAELLAADSFFLNFEFPIRMIRAGHPVSVAEIRCRPRRGGKSKTANLRTILQVAGDLVRLRSRLRRERREAT